MARDQRAAYTDMAVTNLDRIDGSQNHNVSRPITDVAPDVAAFPGIYPALMPRRSKTNLAPLSYAQERLWFLDQINPGDVSANISCGIRILGDLTPDLLQRSVQSSINRHESLRTTFATNQLAAVRDSKPVQLIAATRTNELPVLDLSSEPLNQREAKALALAKDAAQQPFDLTLGPLLRATLLKLGAQEHILLLCLHRIVCDDYSLKILIEELFVSYSALARASGQISPLQIQYADYATWQRQLIEEESFKSALEFWRAKLQGAPGVIELFTDRPKPPVRTWQGQSVEINLDEALVERLRVFAANEGAELAMVLLAALNVVLARHSRQFDLVVGATISNRDEETKHLVGPLANQLSLRSSLSGDPPFRELLSRIKSTLLEARAYRRVPFEKLLEELEVERSLSHAPVFQVTFNLDEVRNGPSEAAGLKLEEYDFDDGIARFDLEVEIRERPGRLNCNFRYSTDLFDRGTIERLGGHFKFVLEGIVCNPDQRLSDLPLMTEPELRQVLVDWNNTATDVGQAKSIPQLFESQAALTPEATAAVFETQQMTYGEVNRRSNQLAHYLKKLGVGPEVLVGICVKRSLEMIVGLLGVLKAGGAYVPLDPAYPAERLRFMLEDSGARLLLTQQPLLKLIPESPTKVICLDSDWPEINKESEENQAAKPAAGNLAYVIYTSGSTGKPKGVAIEHRSVAALLAWARGTFSPEELSGVLASTSICFDLSVFEMFVPLSYGGKVLLADDVLQLLTLPAAKDVKLINTVPSAMVELLRLKGLPEGVQTVNLAGEPLSASLVDKLYEHSQIRRVFDLYGPSEDTTYSTWALRRRDGPTTIGRPIAGTRVYLLDENLHPVPIGVPGELYLGGAGLARGYLNRPELSAKAFVPDPFSEDDTARLYKTGDLARYLADGNIEYLGRLDAQVKVRGYRIELGEIESVLRQHSAVRDVAVVARQGQLVGYVVPSLEQSGNRAKLWSELRNFLKLKLPEYMSPAIFVELDALPLTPNGKVDRRALPASDESRPDLQQAYVAPRDQLEEQLAMLWSNVLQLKSIGIRDNFFELGGNSLMAARLFAQIENRFGKHLPLATLFTSPTIEQLANALRDSGKATGWSSLVAIQPDGSKPPLFCIHAGGANVLIYRPLSRHLGKDQPVYALQAQGLDGQTSPFTRVEDMAAHYIKEIRAFQPEGPYHLLGASFGGLVIYEMAYQLNRQGHKVGLVAMLNTACPVYTRRKRIASHFVHLKQRGPRIYGKAILHGLLRRINKYVPVGNITLNDSGLGAVPDSELQQVLRNRKHYDEALVRTVVGILRADETYLPIGKIYPGRITVFRAIDDPTDFHDNRRGWGALARGGATTYDVPGTHTSMREEPNVAVLVEKLRPCLEKAQVQ